VNYSHIELVLEIARCGTISKAAENLYISQPTLSAALKNIEAEIGTSLFKRSKAGVEPTAFGRKYIKHATEIASQIDTLNNLYKSQQVPPLHLGLVSEGFRFLHDAVFQIRQKYKDINCTLQILECPIGKQIELIKNEEAEIGIISLPESQRGLFLREIRAKGMEYSRLQDAVPGIYISKNSKAFPEHIKQIDKEALLLLMEMPIFTHTGFDYVDLERRVQSTLLTLLKRYQLVPKNPIISNYTGMRMDLVSQFDGFCEGAYCDALYERFSFYDNARFIPFAPEDSQRVEIGWIQRQNHPRSTLANELILMLSE